MNLIGDIGNGAVNGFREVWSNKVRSLLSMSGIILGVAALVAMVGVVQGMMSNLRASFEGNGGILRLDINNREPPEEQQHLVGLSPGRTLADVEAIRIGAISAATIGSDVNLQWQRMDASSGRTWSGLRGVLPDNEQFETRGLMDGRFIASLDVAEKAPVIVIGSHLRTALFRGLDSVVGERIRIRGTVYTVIGELEHYEPASSESRGAQWINRRNYIPLTTALARFRDDERVDEITVMAESVETLPDLIGQVENILLQTRRGVLDFEIGTQDERLAELRRLERSFLFSLGGIAAISLLVGGIGIMNVMLASVSERIREIGVRKAIGARSHDVFVQFLAEAVVISVVGGLLGLVASVGLLAGLRDWIPDGQNIEALPVAAMFWGFAFSSGIGLISGVYPALRAARLDPIDALRYE